MLHLFALISLAIAILCALAIAIDEIRHPQPMRIMNVVWPLTALYLSVLAIPFYVRYGRPQAGMPMHHGGADHAQPPSKLAWHQVALATTHCGAGCTLADLVTEPILFALGVTLLGSALYASFLWDFLAAWALGVLFQYFTIKPMRNLTPAQGLGAAIKADTLSIVAFQLGMYACMILTHHKLHLLPTQPTYWLMMQLAMICGFLTSFPMNRLLLRLGLKETMG